MDDVIGMRARMDEYQTRVICMMPVESMIEVDNISGCLHCLAKNEADKLAVVDSY
jgi:hypothetical protein